MQLVNITLIQWYCWNQELEDEEKQKKKGALPPCWEAALLPSAEIGCIDAVWAEGFDELIPTCWHSSDSPCARKAQLFLMLAVAKSPVFHNIWTRWPFVLRTKARDMEKCVPGAWMMLVVPTDVQGTGGTVSVVLSVCVCCMCVVKPRTFWSVGPSAYALLAWVQGHGWLLPQILIV